MSAATATMYPNSRARRPEICVAATNVTIEKWIRNESSLQQQFNPVHLAVQRKNAKGITGKQKDRTIAAARTAQPEERSRSLNLLRLFEGNRHH